MYKVNNKHIMANFVIVTLILIIGILIFIFNFDSLVESIKTKNFVGIIVTICCVVYMIYGISSIGKLIKIKQELKYLKQKGTLIKDLNFDTVPILSYRTKNKKTTISFASIGYDTGVSSLPWYRLIVKYKTNNGIITLKSKLIFFLPHRKHTTVDLLIDPNNPKRYYIDFNIENINEANWWKRKRKNI